MQVLAWETLNLLGKTQPTKVQLTINVDKMYTIFFLCTLISIIFIKVSEKFLKAFAKKLLVRSDFLCFKYVNIVLNT